MSAPLSPETIRQIKKMAKAGYTRVAIAKATGLHRVTVGRHFGDNAATATKNEGGAPAPSGLTAAQAAKLLYVLASFVQGSCPACKKTTFDLNGMRSGICNWCGAPWTAAPVEQRAAPRRRR